jgi:hypothetical protein
MSRKRKSWKDESLLITGGENRNAEGLKELWRTLRGRNRRD